MAYPYGKPYDGFPPPTYPGYPTGPSYPPSAGYPSFPGYPSARTYYHIRSRLNGLVLDVENENRNPGACVVMWNQKPGNCDNQLWYDDFATGTIRSKLNDFCLDWDGNTVNLRPYYPGNPNQQWERADPLIRSRSAPDHVLDIANNNRAAGAHLISWPRSGNSNQCFDFVGAPPPPMPAVRRHFYIVSDMHGKVLDIEGGSSSPGARVIVWPKKASGDRQNQLWYFDENGLIRSALNDFALTAEDSDICMMPFNNRPPQQWRLVGNHIMRNQRDCLDIARQDRSNGAKLISFPYKGQVNQHWHLEYV